MNPNSDQRLVFHSIQLIYKGVEESTFYAGVVID